MMPADPTRVVLFVGPSHLPAQREMWVTGRRVLCTQQGLLPALAMGLLPEAVFTSSGELPLDVRSRLRDHKVRLITPVKEIPYADVEAALNYAITTGGTDILILGVWSDDPGKALAHVLLLAKPEWGGARVWFAHALHTGYLLRHGEGVSLERSLGTRIALLPLSPKVTDLTSQGTAPQLRYEELELGDIQHIYLTEDTGRVWIGAGRLLVLISPAEKTPEDGK